MPDHPRYAVVIEQTLAQQADDWYRERFGRPAPGIPVQLLGHAWTVRDVVHMRDRASGQATTPEGARLEADQAIERLWCADGHRLWMEETRHQRDGSVSLAELIQDAEVAADAEVDADLERVRRRVFDQDQQ